MAAETYYYLFSLILTIPPLLHLLNLLLLRLKGKSIYGQNFQLGTEEYRRVIKLASIRNIIITAVVSLVLVIHLAYEINRVMNMADRAYAEGLLIYGSLFVIVLNMFLIYTLRKQFGINK